MKIDKTLVQHENPNKRICTTCGAPLLYRDRHGNIITDNGVKRKKKDICPHERAKKEQRRAQSLHREEKARGEQKKKIAKWQWTKDHPDRSSSIAREKKSREAYTKKMKDPLTNPNWVKSQKDKEKKKLGN